MVNWATLPHPIKIQSDISHAEFMNGCRKEISKEELIQKLIDIVYKFINVNHGLSKEDVEQLPRFKRNILLIQSYRVQFEDVPTGLVRKILLNEDQIYE